MRILYIPFNNSGDILAAALSWELSLKQRKKDVCLIHHDHSYPSIVAKQSGDWHVYILGHSLEAAQLLEMFPYHVVNTSPVGKETEFLSMNIIAERFKRDFGNYMEKISVVKLYFCNNHGNEKELAEWFSFFAMPPISNKRIDYYAHTISPPAPIHKFVSNIQGGNEVRVSQVRLSLFNEVESVDEVRRDIKRKAMIPFIEKQHMLRFFSKRNKMNRHNEQMRQRLGRAKMVF